MRAPLALECHNDATAGKIATPDAWPPELPHGVVHIGDIVDGLMARVAERLGHEWPPAAVVE